MPGRIRIAFLMFVAVVLVTLIAILGLSSVL